MNVRPSPRVRILAAGASVFATAVLVAARPGFAQAGACPSGGALKNFKTASNVAAVFSNSGAETTYWFVSLTDENPVAGPLQGDLAAQTERFGPFGGDLDAVAGFERRGLAGVHGSLLAPGAHGWRAAAIRRPTPYSTRPVGRAVRRGPCQRRFWCSLASISEAPAAPLTGCLV